MDNVNIRIIGAVKQLPSLYKKAGSAEDRKHGWKQLAENLNLDEKFLKTRWHFLCCGYTRKLQGAAYFKYKDEMEFLRPYLGPIKLNSAEDEPRCPEFVITEKDIETESETEEYVFLEVETLEGCVEEESTTATNSKSGEEPESNTKNELEQMLRTGTNIYDQQIEIGGGDGDGEDDCSSGNNIGENNKASLLTEQREAAMKAVAHQETATPQAEEQKAATALILCNDDAIAKSTEERGEDTIFGELVTAILRPMPAEKKRSVKKDIMNLLLT